MNTSVLKITFILSFTACVGISGCCYFIYKKRKSERMPKNWRKLANVTKLYVYPLKSGRYMDMEKVECSKFGFSLPAEEGKFQLRDRSFIIYGEDDLMGKSARTYPKLVLVSISSSDIQHVVFEAPGQDALHVQIPIKNNNNLKMIKFQNWSTEYVSTIDFGDKASQWFSQYLLQNDSGLRLGYHEVSSYRNLSSFKDKESLKYLKFYKYISNSVFGLYSDLTAILLLNEKSLQDLNEKLEKNVSRTHFRPNIVIDDLHLDPFVEDNYLWMKIGDVIVRYVMDCTRCILSTVDPETAVRDTGREPLRTLSKYRISKGPTRGPIMGVHMEVVVPGTISVNDEVLVGVEDF